MNTIRAQAYSLKVLIFYQPNAFEKKKCTYHNETYIFVLFPSYFEDSIRVVLLQGVLRDE